MTDRNTNPERAREARDEYTVQQVRECVRASIDAPGCSHNQFARETGIAGPALSEFLSGKRGAESRIIDKLGFRWAIVRGEQDPDAAEAFAVSERPERETGEVVDTYHEIDCPNCTGEDCTVCCGHEALAVPGTCTLAECPPGLFRFQGMYGFKSEYTTTLENPRRYQCDAYVVESGEYFHGGSDGDVAARSALIVQPVELRALATPLPSGGDQSQDARGKRLAAVLRNLEAAALVVLQYGAATTPPQWLALKVARDAALSVQSEEGHG